jgi:hypothetical protein
MIKRAQNTWYVSYRLREQPRKNGYSRRWTKSFPNEAEAKNFARSKLAEAQDVAAGTLNPHLPKRIIRSESIADWLAPE